MADEGVVERTEGEVEADFEAGRQLAMGNEEVVKVELPEKPEEVEKADDTEELEVETEVDEIEAGVDASADEIVMAGLTENEIKTALAKANELDGLKESFGSETQKIYGKFGEIQRALKQLSENKGSAKLGKGSLAKLSEQYPELAELLEEDLGQASLGGASPFDSTELESRFTAQVDKRVAGITQDLNIKLLKLKHPDYQEKEQTPDYKNWLATLEPKVKADLLKSDDGLYISSKFDEFDKWRNRGAKKTNRLDRAITPTGSPPEPKQKTLSSNEAFEAGRKATQRKLGILR